MDQYSHRLANRLVGNSDTAATLEATLMGPQLALEEDGAFAVTGASFSLTVNDTTVELNQMIDAKAGSIVKFGERQRGARAYIAIAGGIDVPMVLGSRSTHVLTRMGGFDGRALRAGDRLQTESDPFFCGISANIQKKGSDPFIPDGGARLRVIPGEPQLFAHLTSQRFRISPDSNRMGYRLEGAAIDVPPTGEFISRAVATGAIQVPPTGQPILLMADHATSGGYAIGATVITADLSVAGQLAPGDWIEFQSCSLEAADQALREQEAAFGGV